MFVVIFVYIKIREIQVNIYKKQAELEELTAKDYFIRQLPSLASSILIFVFAFLFKIIAEAVTKAQNHQYYDAYQDALVQKLYVINIFIAYTNLVYLAYTSNSFELVTSNYFSIVLVGALLNQFQTSLILRATKGRAISKLENDDYFNQIEKDTQTVYKQIANIHLLLEKENDDKVDGEVNIKREADVDTDESDSD